MIQEKVIPNWFENLAFIHGGLLKHVWVRGGHGGRESNGWFRASSGEQKV
jgi:hypothetical protein